MIVIIQSKLSNKQKIGLTEIERYYMKKYLNLLVQQLQLRID